MEQKRKEAEERKKINDKIIADIKYTKKVSELKEKKKSNRHRYAREGDNIIHVIFDQLF